MWIGEFARKSGVAPSTVRYYESAGVLPLARRIGGRRSYAASELIRLKFIVGARACGFSLREIRTVFAHGASDADARERFLRAAKEKTAGIDHQLLRLRWTRQLLNEMAHCDCRVVNNCWRVTGFAELAAGYATSPAAR